MKQKGKLLTCILCVMLGICCVLGFSSCKKGCKSGHTWGEWYVMKAATCVEEGERVHTCTKCKTAETEKIGALGHDWADATCVTPKTCKRCFATEGEPLAHTFDKEVANESTLKRRRPARRKRCTTRLALAERRAKPRLSSTANLSLIRSIKKLRTNAP